MPSVSRNVDRGCAAPSCRGTSCCMKRGGQAGTMFSGCADGHAPPTYNTGPVGVLDKGNDVHLLSQRIHTELGHCCDGFDQRLRLNLYGFCLPLLTLVGSPSSESTWCIQRQGVEHSVQDAPPRCPHIDFRQSPSPLPAKKARLARH